MNFQLGSDWPDKFRKAWQAMKSGDYETAAVEVARGGKGGDSLWKQQSKNRVEEFQAALRNLPPRSSADGH